jgi:hypothetical protein
MKFFQPACAVPLVVCLVAPAWGQTPPAQTPKPQAAPGQTPPAQPKPAQRRPAARPTETTIVVRDVSGTPISGVTIAISGGAMRDVTTDAHGVATVSLRDGSYRLRLEHEGFIAFEREVTIRNGLPTEVGIALNRAPAPAPPPPAPAPPPPPPAPAPAPAPAPVTLGPAGPPTTVAIPTFLDKNFIGREPLKESILGCMPAATTRLLQLKEPLAAHTHANVDEVLYVVAGDGAVKITTGDAVVIGPGSMMTIPRGTQHAVEKRGRNPLILLSVLAGAPCPTASLTAATRKDN